MSIYRTLVVFLVVLVALTAGCANINNKISPYAVPPVNGESVILKSNDFNDPAGEVTIGRLFVSPYLLVETRNAKAGTWPIIARRADGSLVFGQMFLSNPTSLSEMSDLRPAYWGDNEGMFIFPSRLEVDDRIIVLSHDGGQAFTAAGGVIAPKEGGITYDPIKFADDNGYRDNFFGAYGISLIELRDFWSRYLFEKGADRDKTINVISRFSLSSPEWRVFVETLIKRFPTRYQIGEDIYLSALNDQEFLMRLGDIAGFTPGERFVKGGGVSAPLFPFTPEVIVISNGIGVVANGFRALTDESISGLYGQAPVTRQDMAPLVGAVSVENKLALAARDEEIRRLREENARLNKQ